MTMVKIRESEVYSFNFRFSLGYFPFLLGPEGHGLAGPNVGYIITITQSHNMHKHTHTLYPMVQSQSILGANETAVCVGCR